MSDLISTFIVVLETMMRGSGDLRDLVIPIAVFAVVIGLVVILGLLVGTWLPGVGQSKAELPAASGRDRVRITPVVLALLALFVLIGDGYASRPETCGYCHVQLVTDRDAGGHSTIGCVQCHREPGPIGFALGQVDYVRWLVRAGAVEMEALESGVGRAFVSNSACLRCHRAVQSGTLSDGVISVRHEDFLGRSCTDCHNTVGHGEQVRFPTRPDMRLCLTCHDGRQVVADCALCHQGDVSQAARRSMPRPSAIKVAAPTGTDCKGCHATDGCNECHGVEMPHPPDWMPGHARPAFERPDTCWRCHVGPDRNGIGAQPYAVCNQCHRFPGPHGPSGQWRARHGAAAAKAPGIIGRTRCGLCHTNERFCDLCHEGRRERVDYR